MEEREPSSRRQGPGHYHYYSTQRPVDIGTYPKPPGNGPIEIFNYDGSIPVESGNLLAWGELIYGKPLTEKQMCDYELKPSSHNPDRAEPPKETERQKTGKSHEDR